MRRRDFIAALGSTVAVLPFAAGAQQSLPVVGFLSTATRRSNRVRAFLKGLEEAGYAEGTNVTIEYRFADDQFDRLPAQAAELVQRPVTLLAASGIPASLVAKAATATIPIVFYVAGDPVRLGLVPRLNRPGGNLTGVTSLGGELSAKRLELARELVPKATAIGFLVNPNNPNSDALINDAQTAARSLKFQLHVQRATRDSEIDTSFAHLAQLKVGALVIGNDGLFVSRTEQLAALALRHKLPAVFQASDFAAAGGLISYGADVAEAHRQFGAQAGRLLKGEKPGDLPVVQSTKIELIANLKTAKALGIAVPLPLLGRADEVIE